MPRIEFHIVSIFGELKDCSFTLGAEGRGFKSRRPDNNSNYLSTSFHLIIYRILHFRTHGLTRRIGKFRKILNGFWRPSLSRDDFNNQGSGRGKLGG
jgi:hypothetical protein